MNLVEPILFQCRWQPSALAICVPGSGQGSVTYGDLARFIHSVSWKAQREGLAKGNVVALFIRDPILHCLVTLGLAKIGVVTLSRRIEPLPSELGVDAMLTDVADAPAVRCRTIMLDGSWIENKGSEVASVGIVKMDDDDPCRIVLTSGTTSDPKALARSSKQIYLRTLRFQTALGSCFPTCSRIFLDPSISTGLGFTFFVHVLSRGGALFLKSSRAPTIFQDISKYQIQALIATPKTLAELAELSDRASGFPGRFEVVISLGSMLNKHLAERVRARLSNEVISVYGSTETGAVASAHANSISGVEGAVGYVIPGVETDIVDAEGNTLGAGREGLVRIRGESVLGGYLGDPELTKARFKDDGFYTGDIGSISEDGLLIISGRAGSVINLGGEKVIPEQIEAGLLSFESVIDAAVFSVMTPVGVEVLGSAIVWRGKADPDSLKEHARRKFPSQKSVPLLYMQVEEVPRNSSGKIDRAALKKLAMAHVSAPRQ